MKDGQAPNNPLLMYVVEDKNVAIVVSNGGAAIDWDLSWWSNLGRNPHAEIQIKSEKRKVRAEKAAPEEKEEETMADTHEDLPHS